MATPAADAAADPLEVRLVEEVARCRACSWFWADPPYGPYPTYAFASDFPPEVRARAEAAAPDPAPWLEGRVGGGFVDPQILHGCRKAPVMTIGINPNLAAFWPGTKGSRAAYPRFDRAAQAAYHYRYRTLYQEAVDADFVRRHASPDGALLAEGAGRIDDVRFESDRRRWQVTIAYESAELGRRTHVIEWDSKRNFVLLFDRAPAGAPAQFQAGEPVGAFLDLPAEAGAQALSSEPVGYYQRIVPVLSVLEAHFQAMGGRPRLSLGEDVSQLDMVACSSPGWGDAYRIDKAEVTANCVAGHAWALKQLVQSRPAVIVFSGRSAYEMFHARFAAAIEPALEPGEREVYDLLAATARWPYYLDLRAEVGGAPFRLRARVVVAPHFSYDDNFVPHSRFSPAGWAAFEQAHGAAVAALRGLGKVLEPSRDGYVPVAMRDLGAFQSDFPEAMAPLLRNFYDPLQMLGGLLVQEAVLGNLALDPTTGRLVRAEGPCRFCANARWTFPEGCAYGKPAEPPLPPAYLEAVVQALLRGGDSHWGQSQ